jgi:RND family efflux transporter MFP subunit
MNKTILAITLLLTPLVQATEPNENAAALKLASATLESMPNHQYLDGTVEAVNRSTVSAQTSGQVKEILFDIDDFVSKDQVIVRLHDTTQRTALEQAEAQFKQVKSDHERIASIFKKGVATEAEMEKAETALTSAKAALESAQEQLSYTVIKAPYTGIVMQRHIEPGETASPGTPLMTGISLEKLRVSVDVPQSLVNKVREFDSAFVLPGEGPPIAVTKITIYPYADPNSGTFKVRLELPTIEQQLYPGMFVKTAFLTGQRELLTVPTSSIVYRSEVTGIYVVNDAGDISLRHIRVGNQFAQRTAILAGLEPGEQIALDPVAAGIMARQAAGKE